MICQMLSCKPVKEFESKIAKLTTKFIANCNLVLDAVVMQIFPKNAHAKQKKCLRQGK
jgi:hypothetical protein